MELILSFILGLALCFITGGVPAVDTALPVSEPAPIAASAIEEATENAIAIEGIVKERGSDKAVPNATVTATRDSDGAIRTVICDASGFYKLENLPAGAYTITAEAADYEPKSISGMRFTAGTRNKIDIAVKRSMGKDEMIIQTVLDSLGPDLVARMKAAGIELSFDFSYMVKGNDTENGIMIITLEMRSAIGFRMGDKAKTMPEVVEVVVGLSINQWQDRRSVQCELRQIKPFMPAKAFLSECQRSEAEIDGSMIAMLAKAGAPSYDSRVEQMTLEEAKMLLGSELLTGYQGTLLCVHTLSALKLLNIHLAILHAQLDYCMHALDDIRSFNTLVMAPDWEKLNCHPRAIVALDGFLCEAEKKLIRARFPDARLIEVTDMASHAAAAAARLLPDDDSLRTLYRVLRQREKMEYTMNILEAETGLSQSRIRCGLEIFRELGLLEYQAEPLSYRLLKSGKVSLEDSSLRSRLISIRG